MRTVGNIRIEAVSKARQWTSALKETQGGNIDMSAKNIYIYIIYICNQYGLAINGLLHTI